MVEFSLGEHLRYLRDFAHEDLVIETPPRCQALWERGQAAGFHLGRLYVLSRPLTPGVGGEYHPLSGDVWVLHDPTRPEQVARTLLHELADAQRPPAAPAPTIDASCDEEAATEERTRDLADAWGVADLFGDEDLRAALAAVETLRERLATAGELAGTLALAAARAAYAALLRLAGEAGWAGATLDDALFGVADEATVARALDFDRCALRGRWRLGWGAGIDFGSLALTPDAASGALLRSALRAVAEGRPPGKGSPTGPCPVGDRRGTPLSSSARKAKTSITASPSSGWRAGRISHRPWPPRTPPCSPTRIGTPWRPGPATGTRPTSGRSASTGSGSAMAAMTGTGRTHPMPNYGCSPCHAGRATCGRRRRCSSTSGAGASTPRCGSRTGGSACTSSASRSIRRANAAAQRRLLDAGPIWDRASRPRRAPTPCGQQARQHRH